MDTVSCGAATLSWVLKFIDFGSECHAFNSTSTRRLTELHIKPRAWKLRFYFVLHVTKGLLDNLTWPKTIGLGRCAVCIKPQLQNQRTLQLDIRIASTLELR